MSSSNRGSAERERQARAQANAKNVEKLITEIGTHPKIMSGGAEDSGAIDELKNTDMPAEILIPYIYGKMRAENDNSRAWTQICDFLERGLPAVNGKRAKMQGDIAMAGLSGGSRGDKVLKRSGFVDRHFRGKPEFKEVSAKEEDEE